MLLYFLPDERRYVHRQTDIPKGVEAKKIDVPTDLAGLMAFLNDLWAAFQIDLDQAQAPAPAVDWPADPAVAAAAPPLPNLDTSASGTLSRIDNPGIDVDAIVEILCNAKGHALKRYAGGVAMAFQRLTT